MAYFEQGLPLEAQKWRSKCDSRCTEEIEIDLSQAKAHKLTEELAGDAQLLVTMGCGDKYPYVPGLRRADWPLPDPKGQPIE